MIRCSKNVLLPLAGLLFAALASGAAPKADILPASVRQQTVATAELLAQPAKAPALPSELRPPFNPPGFDLPAPEEIKAREANQQAEASRPKTEKEILAIIAEKVTPSGIFVVSGQPILIMNKKKYRVGDSFTVTVDARDYDLEISAIDRGSYSLRLNRSEITRPIKAGKTP